VIPLVVGDATPQEVADVLRRLWGGPETLIVEECREIEPTIAHTLLIWLNALERFFRLMISAQQREYYSKRSVSSD
jgi:hypothetical protein